MAAQNRAGRPKGAVNPHGLHDLGVLDLAEAANESQAALRALAHAMRRANDAHAHLARAYQRITTGWARDHGDTDPTPLADVIPFPNRTIAA